MNNCFVSAHQSNFLLPIDVENVIPFGTIEIGSIFEASFVLKCLEMGLRISKPINHNYPYDYIVDNGTRLLKIQVKGTDGNAHLIAHSSSKKQYYKPGDFDYLTLCMSKIWFVIPAHIFYHRMKVRVGLSIIQQYREKWIYLQGDSKC